MSRIVRGHLDFEDQFTTVPNAWLRDERLSYKARGLLAHLMSHKEGWSVTVQSLAGKSKDGKDSVRSGIRELERAGYLHRVGRTRDGQGRLGDAEWFLQEPPVAGNPPLGNPPTVNPPLGNPPPLEEQPLEEHLEEHSPLPGLESVLPEKADPMAGFDEFYAAYPRKVGGVAAAKAWPKAVRNAGSVDRIIAGAKRERDMVAQKLRKLDFVAYPATWLNKGKWDEYESGFVPDAPTPPPAQNLSKISWDFSQKRASDHLTPEEREILANRAAALGRPFREFTQAEAAEMIKNRVPE